MNKKFCNKCKTEKELSCFGKHKGHKSGLQSVCKECKRKQDKENYEKNKETILEKQRNDPNTKIRRKKQYENNKEKELERGKKYRQEHPEEISLYNKGYKQSHKKERNLHEKEKRDGDILYRLKSILRGRLRDAIKNNYKSGSAVRDLGCSIADLKIWLEQQFYPHPITGEMMTWSNYGQLWHIDHIYPLSAVDLTDRKQLLKVCHWFNLRPLWKEENLKKGNKI